MTAPEAVQQLAQQRADARASKDFARADELRDAIDAAGWRVVDVADGFELIEKPPFVTFPSVAAVDFRVSGELIVTVIVDGWPDDVDACLSALVENLPDDASVLAVDCGNVSGAGLRVEEWSKSHPGRVHAIHLEPTLQQIGWAAVVQLAIDISECSAFAVMDMSTILEGNPWPALLEVFADESVVATGWRGVNVNVEDAWRSFDQAGPGEVDAVLGYLMVVRGRAAQEVGPEPKARFYRNADMEWSLLLRDSGGRIVIPASELPIRQDRHHGYHDSEPNYRDKQSKKTYDRILQRFRGRKEILAPR